MWKRRSTDDLISPPNSPRRGAASTPTLQRSPPERRASGRLLRLGLSTTLEQFRSPPLSQRRELGSEKFLQLPEVTQPGGHKANTAFDMEIEAQREVN